MSDLTDLLRSAGFGVVIGADATQKKIEELAEGNGHLCSGYGVYPDGSKCAGCDDCKQMGREP